MMGPFRHDGCGAQAGRRSRDRPLGSLMVVALVVAVAGCSGGSTSSTSKSTKVLTPTELHATLLTLTDLPIGWGPPSASPTLSTSATSATSGLLCNGRQLGFLQSGRNATVRFAEAGGAPQLVEELVSLPKRQASDEYAVARDLLHSCLGKSWTVTDSQGAKTDFSLRAGSIPTRSARDVSVDLAAASTRGTFDAGLVFFRDRTVFGVIAAVAGSGADPSSTDPVAYAVILRTAERKITDAVQGRPFTPPKRKHSRKRDVTAP